MQKNWETTGENTHEHKYTSFCIREFERALSRCHQPLLTTISSLEIVSESGIRTSTTLTANILIEYASEA
jgi:hypothetical protein